MARIVVNTGHGHTVVVTRDRTIAMVRRGTAAVKVAAAGSQGPAGAPGASGAGLLPPIEFAFGDASPATVLTLGQASEITAVSLQVEEAFDGAAAAMQLGVAGDPGSLIPLGDSALGVLATFEYSPRKEYPAGTALVLTITPGAGATQGRGQIIVSAVPTT